MVVKILRLSECIKKFKSLKGIDFTPVIREATQRVHRTARDLAPVDTGYLRGSIRFGVTKERGTKVTGVVYTPVEYAPYQEFGTRYQKGTPFLKPALDINRAQIERSVESFVKRNLRQRVK